MQSEIFRMPFKVLWLSSHILLQKARKTAESHQVSLYAINFFFFLEQLVYNQVIAVALILLWLVGEKKTRTTFQLIG